MKKCMYCKCEVDDSSLIDFCERCGKGVFGEKMFNAIVDHPNVIFLFPNALYAEIDVNYDTNTMSLIRGHDYPPGIKNGFKYEIEEQFHEYEYDNECLEWEFIEIKNGYHLNCYPDGSIHYNLELIAKIKDL